MPNMLFANNCNTTLSSSLTNVATTMSVTSATGFPSPTGSQYFYCTLADAATQTTIEIVKVTAVSGTTFTIVRGQDGTSGTAFSAGDVVSLRLVRASLNDFPKLDEVNTFSQTQTFSAAPITSTLTGFVYGNGASAQTVATNAQLLTLLGTLPVGNGGTGLTSLTSGYIPYGNGTSAFNSSSNLTFDGTSLGIGTASPQDYAGYHGLTIDGTTGGNIDIRTSGSIALEIVANTATETYIKNVTSTPMWFGTANTERMRLFPSGGLSLGNTTDPGATNLSVTGTGKFGTTVGVGAATPSTSGAGITFPATQSASSDANTLDDYEEGTWTPNIGGTATYNGQTGYYTKVGRQVSIICDLFIDVLGTGSQNSVLGLPFTSLSFSTISIGYFNVFGVPITYISGFVGPSGNSINITSTLVAATATSGNNVITSGSRIIFSGTYFV